MLLTAPLLSKSSTFFGTLLHKFRQVKITKTQKLPTTTTNNTIKNTNNNNNNFTPTKNAADTATETANASAAANNATKNLLNDSRPALIPPNASVAAISKHSITTTAVGHKSFEEKIGLPPRPKRPITPFFRFMRDMRPKLLAEKPKLTTQDLVKELSKQWPSADAKLKERLQNEYKREQQIYVEERAKYDAKVTPEQRAEISQLKKEKQEATERLKLRRRNREMGRPKRPPSAFFRFIHAERDSKLPNQTYREWHQKTTEKWSRLSAAEKEHYMKKTKDEMEIYKKQLNAWEEKMMRAGHPDLVRLGYQIDPPEPKPKKR